jgi:FhuF 2Fe-2S C-terminal domain
VGSVVDVVAGLGPFFGFETYDAGAPADAGWRGMAELTADPAVLDARVAAVRERLAGGRDPGAVAWRVAASVAHLGLVARLVSPLLGLTACHHVAPAVTLADLRWRAELGGAFPLALPGSVVEPPPAGADAGLDALLDGVFAPLVEAVAAASVSRRVLWGNVASAAHGAAAAAALAGPAAGPAVRWAAGAFLGRPRLRGTWDVEPNGRFQRTSCCLIYRARPTGRAAVCGDCVLARPRRSA